MTLYVRMTDFFMSGWGASSGKTNVFVVECDTAEQAEQIERAAKRRTDMKRVRICLTPPKARPSILYTRKRFADLSGSWLE